MAASKSKRKSDPPRDDDQQDDSERTHEPGTEEGGAVLVHQAYLAHRFSGGEPPDPEAYRRGLEHFERLPGAIRSLPPTPPRPEPDPVDDTADPNEAGDTP